MFHSVPEEPGSASESEDTSVSAQNAPLLRNLSGGAVARAAARGKQQQQQQRAVTHSRPADTAAPKQRAAPHPDHLQHLAAVRTPRDCCEEEPSDSEDTTEDSRVWGRGQGAVHDRGGVQYNSPLERRSERAQHRSGGAMSWAESGERFQREAAAAACLAPKSRVKGFWYQ